MGSSSKLVSSDGIESQGWSNSRRIMVWDHEAVGADQTPGSAPVEQQLPRDRTPDQSEPLKCPRCESTNTKFCYFNNYNKSQPRHFCRTCKRHWTEGGTLRNVPVGGSRKKKRLKTAAAATSASSAAGAAVSATVTTSAVAKYSEAAFDSEIFGDSNISDSILSLPHQDIEDLLLPFPVSSPSDSVITSILPTAGCSFPMTWQAGIAKEVAATAASFWSWEDVESLVSTNEGKGSGWGDSKV